MNLNKVFLFGNLTRDPELKALPSGIQVASFGLATNRRTKRNERWEDVAEFHNIVTFGKTAELVNQYMKKGGSIFIEGRIQTRSWDSPEKGGKQYRTEIIAERIQFGPRAGGAGQAGAGGPSSSPTQDPGSKAPKEDAIEYPSEDINPEDIPF